MPKATIICYLSSLLFYGMGYSKMLNVDVNTYDFPIYVSLATTYFVLTIFLAVIGSLSFYVKTKNQVNGSDKVKRSSTPVVKARLSQCKYGMDLERRMSS